MAQLQSKARRLGIRRGILIAFLCFLVVSVLQTSGVLSSVDLKLLDLGFRFRGQRDASGRIALVEVDDATIRAYGQWPIPRDSYALLISAIAESGARAIGVDLLFLGPDAHDPTADLLLAGVTAKYPNVVHAISFLSEPERPGTEQTESAKMPDLLRTHGVRGRGVRAPLAGSVSLPHPSIFEASSAVGHATVAVDEDGGIRRLPLFVRYRGLLYPALGVRVAGVAEGHDAPPEVEATREGMTIVWPSGRRLQVPLDDEGATAIDFAGNHAAFPHAFSMLDVLGMYRDGKHDALSAAFEGRTVLIGNTAVGEAATDVGATPFSVATPLVYIHANVVDAIQNGRFLRALPRAFYLSMLGALSLLLGWLFVRLALPVAAGIMGGSTVLITFVGYGVFALWGICAPATATLALPPLVYAAVASYRFVFLERKAREDEKEMEVARQVQQNLFPRSLPEPKGWEFAGTCRPSMVVSGDYYDIFEPAPGKVLFALGDVSGKGMGASLLMASVHATIRSRCLLSLDDPRQLVTDLNRHLLSSTDVGNFVTLFLGVVDLETARVRYVNAGHPPALVTGSDGSVREELGEGGPVLGIMDADVYASGEVHLNEGDSVVVVSDGVTEATNEKKRMYEEEGILIETLGSAAGSRAKDLMDQVVRSVDRFRGSCELGDDLSVVVIRRSPASQPGTQPPS